MNEQSATPRKCPNDSLTRDHVNLLMDGGKGKSGRRREGEEFLGSNISRACVVGRPRATLKFRSHTRLQTMLSPGRRGMRDSGGGGTNSRPARQEKLMDSNRLSRSANDLQQRQFDFH